MTHIPSYNPSRNYEIIDSVESTPPASLKLLVERARSAQTSWKKISIAERKNILESAYQLYVERKEELSQSIAKNMGMPIRQARDEVEY